MQNESSTHMNIGTRITALAALVAGLAANPTLAQERLSPEETRPYAEMVGSVQSELRNAPCITPVDLQRSVAMRDGEYGVMVVPAVRLSGEALSKVEAGETLPVGQLWLLRLAPLVDEQVVANERLQLVAVSGSEGSATVPCCTLGVRKAAGGLELVVFGKGKDPITKAPLATVASSQAQPVDLKVERESDRGRVTVKLAGKYAASLAVTDPELF
jgi:hypothetical protein